MKKITLLLSAIVTFTLGAEAQSGYDIKINFKGCKDTMVYLVKYTFDQQYISDTCKDVKNGAIRFKGKKDLDKGVYVLVSEGKSTYFDIFINENQKFAINADMADMVNTLKSVGNKENEQFFSYIKFITSKNQDFGKISTQAKGKSKEDSTKFMNEKLNTLNSEVKAFESDFMTRNKGTYLYDVMNLKTEKEPIEIPKAKNGRPDSIYQYYYYKNHYFDGIDFKDERIIRTPFFDDRVKRYFEKVIVVHPDTMIKEIDKVLAKCTEGNLVYNLLLGYFTYTSEQNKIMGFDKVFVHLADKYIISGKASGVYTDETAKKIKERVDIMRNLLLDAQVSDLFMIDSIYGRQVLNMGFDTAKTSKSITELYYKNIDRLTPMFKSLYQVKAKYTVLIFWAEDCGHCQTEVPKLNDGLKELKGKIDFKVYAVQTKEELYEQWKKFISEKKLTDFINVFDPIHLNNLKERFDIYSTPVIYILDKDKRIKAKRLGAEQVVEMLKMLDSIDKSKAK
ncbi:MAG: thioredoxin-like domain-containing protein [Bacteroidota bacterium]